MACHTEQFSAEVIGRLPKEVKIVANFSVGFDHVDIEAAKKRGLVVTNTPDVLSWWSSTGTASRCTTRPSTKIWAS